MSFSGFIDTTTTPANAVFPGAVVCNELVLQGVSYPPFPGGGGGVTSLVSGGGITVSNPTGNVTLTVPVSGIQSVSGGANISILGTTDPVISLQPNVTLDNLTVNLGTECYGVLTSHGNFNALGTAEVTGGFFSNGGAVFRNIPLAMKDSIDDNTTVLDPQGTVIMYALVIGGPQGVGNNHCGRANLSSGTATVTVNSYPSFPTSNINIFLTPTSPYLLRASLPTVDIPNNTISFVINSSGSTLDNSEFFYMIVGF